MLDTGSGNSEAFFRSDRYPVSSIQHPVSIAAHMGFLPVYYYFILISFLVSLTVYFKPGTGFSYLKFWPPFLLITLVVEFIGSYLFSIGTNNVVLYNFFSILEFSFYLFILSLLFRNQRVRKVIRILILPYVILAAANILFNQGLNTFHTITYSLGCLLIVTFCIYYFFELFRMPHSVKLKNDPAFWICTGLLFFFCCTFPLYGLINFWVKSGISQLILKSFDSIVIILNAFLYTLFTIAFLCVKNRKYTLSSS